ncbi:hypothetical protein [Aurantiacibacter flavus]|uniref:Uncharacterized protein n=1 Tax=Aurantiacibacter flavus TaxID=3145232 RepID=A0ABV0CZ42_9SPHN
MSASVTRVREIVANPAEVLRFAVVTACALALIAAGQALPF